MRIDSTGPPVRVQPFQPAARLERTREGTFADAVDATAAREDAPSAAARERTDPSRPTSDERGAGERELTDEQKREVEQLKRRDREVKAHEQAHQAAGGAYAGAPKYEYETGPDDRRYAVGGEVSIDASPVAGDPEATIRKMEVVRKAALAPQEPSVQDQRVAQKASVQEAQARRELTEQRNEELGAAVADPRSRAQRAYAFTDPVLSPGVLFDATG